VIEGDFAKLHQIIEAVGQVPEKQLELATLFAEFMRKSVEQEFWRHQDPYGSTWAPRKRDYPYNPLMVRSGELMTGFYTSATAEGATIANDVPWAIYHQFGTVVMEARRMFPEFGDLGDWQDPLEHVALAFLQRSLEAT
jgi:phage gpG-like protein